jgi:D-3-phosphoglycerate dehydrogenase
MKIFVTCDCDLCPEALEPLRRIGQVDYRPPPYRDEVLDSLVEYSGWMCNTALRIDDAVLDRATSLKVIATSSTGTDHIDKKSLAQRGIQLIDIAREYELLDSFTATAEGAWALLLAAVRRLPQQFERAKQGCIGWDDTSWAPPQLSSKALGVVGCGRLGRMVAEYGRAFRMRVLAYDAKSLNLPDVEQVDLDTLLAESDFVSLHLHLTDETRHVLDDTHLAAMKKGAVIVNTARGDLIDEQALLDALQSGHIGAAGLDVVHNEWDARLSDHPLLEYARTHDNLIVTGHVASACYESIAGARIFVARKLAEALRR